MGNNVLVIGAHNDECEYGLGGVTVLLKERGCNIHYINTSGLWHKPDHTKEEACEWERQEQKSAEILGATKDVLGDRDKNISEDDQDLVLKIEKIILEHTPNIVFIHWPEDNHLEHRISAKAAYEALCIAYVHGARINEIYAFEAGPNQTSDYFVPDFAINIDGTMNKITDSLMQFNQPTAQGTGLVKEKILQAHYRGYCFGFENAECFKIIKFPNDNNNFYLKELLNSRFKWAGNGMYPAFGKYYFK